MINTEIQHSTHRYRIPKLMIDNFGAIILVKKINGCRAEGMVLDSGIGHWDNPLMLYEYRDDFILASLSDYRGTVILENKKEC